jgi:hypothetical protein
MRRCHRASPSAHQLRSDNLAIVLATPLAQDPTGLSSPLGQIVVLIGLLASLVVLLRWWWQNRGR